MNHTLGETTVVYVYSIQITTQQETPIYSIGHDNPYDLTVGPIQNPPHLLAIEDPEIRHDIIQATISMNSQPGEDHSFFDKERARLIGEITTVSLIHSVYAGALKKCAGLRGITSRQ